MFRKRFQTSDMYPSPAVSDSDCWHLGLMHMCMSESESLCTYMTDVYPQLCVSLERSGTRMTDFPGY